MTMKVFLSEKGKGVKAGKPETGKGVKTDDKLSDNYVNEIYFLKQEQLFLSMKYLFWNRVKTGYIIDSHLVINEPA